MRTIRAEEGGYPVLVEGRECVLCGYNCATTEECQQLQRERAETNVRNAQIHQQALNDFVGSRDGIIAEIESARIHFPRAQQSKLVAFDLFQRHFDAFHSAGGVHEDGRLHDIYQIDCGCIADEEQGDWLERCANHPKLTPAQRLADLNNRMRVAAGAGMVAA
jgi:hypothetical protein